jgi:hypothetical protein
MGVGGAREERMFMGNREKMGKKWEKMGSDPYLFKGLIQRPQCWQLSRFERTTIETFFVKNVV